MNKKLKAKIVEKFGTQTDFAQAVDEDEAVISRVVRGRKRLSPERRRKWECFLGCNLRNISRED